MADRRPAHRARLAWRARRMTAQLSGLSSALIASAAGERVQIVCGLEPASPGTVALGPALTVRVHPGDNLAVHLAVARAAAGPVIIVDACGEPNVAFTGGLVVCAAALTGVAGIGVDGAIRDRADIAAMRFPIFRDLAAGRSQTLSRRAASADRAPRRLREPRRPRVRGRRRAGRGWRGEQCRRVGGHSCSRSARGWPPRSRRGRRVHPHDPRD
jgi:hypothetical protein